MNIDDLQSSEARSGSHCSLLWVCGGAVQLATPECARFVLDDDSYVVIPDAQSDAVIDVVPLPAGRVLRATWPLDLIAREFHQVLEADLLWLGSDLGITRTAPLLGHLRANDPIVSPVLRFVARSGPLAAQSDDWRRSHAALLLQRLLRSERELRAQIAALPGRKLRTKLSAFMNVQRSVAYIHRHYSRHLDIAELAAVASMSHWYFARLFHAVTALTPREYLQRKRVAVALRLIRLRQYDLAAIASHVGFEDRRTLHCRLLQYYGASATRLKGKAGVAPPILTSRVSEIRKPHDATLFSTG